MTTSKGTIQGYNCQTVADELHQIVVATEAFGVGQDQSLLKPMIEQIRENLGEDCLSGNVLLTADTGYSSEDNMKYLFNEGINAVVPDTNFRQRDPKIAGSETVAKHKAHRQKTRKDKRKNTAKFPAADFTVNKETKTCICPNGHEMMYHGDHFEINNKLTLRGKAKVTCQWMMCCIVHNIEKLWRYGNAGAVSV